MVLNLPFGLFYITNEVCFFVYNWFIKVSIHPVWRPFCIQHVSFHELSMNEIVTHAENSYDMGGS